MGKKYVALKTSRSADNCYCVYVFQMYINLKDFVKYNKISLPCLMF